MRSPPFLLLLILLAGYIGRGLAYEVETHAEMSRNAAKASVLGDSSPNELLRALGLQYPIEEDVKQGLPNSENTSKSILELIADGARFEDGFNDCESRPKNHFYDPLRNIGLRWKVLVRGEASPDWALEDESLIADQLYSLRDARDYLYQGLTSKDKPERDRFLGLMFQTLGHVTHHVHDMAQPQHVRNDAHLKVQEACWYKKYVQDLENPSLYEDYTNQGSARENFAALITDAKIKPPVFSTARGYWITNIGGSDRGKGKGLAEFTNNNFLSAGTNFKLDQGDQVLLNARYPQPAPSGPAESVPIEQLLTEKGETVPCWENSDGTKACLAGEIDFYPTLVTDKYAAPTTNRRASSLSMFDADLKRYGAAVVYENDPEDPTDNTIEYRAFTLNRFNFDEAHKFLIPRAVAYSAGLINHFFRGRLEIQDAGFSDQGLTLRVKNAIDEKIPEYKDHALEAGGTLVVAFDYKVLEGGVEKSKFVQTRWARARGLQA